MVDYARMQATATRLIRANGRKMTLVKFDRTNADNAKPWDGPTDARNGTNATRVTATVVDAPILELRRLGLIGIAEDLIMRSDSQVIIDGQATDEDLRNFNEVVDGTETLKISAIERLKPGPLTMMYAATLVK